MALTDVIFRTIAKLGFTTKGSELTWTELDRNFEYIIDELTSINTGAAGNVAPYNPLTTYDNTVPTYVSYSGNIYQYINASPSAGNTPSTSPLYWQLTSSGALTHQQNTDTILALGTSNEVSAAELKELLTSGVISDTWAALNALRIAGQLKAGRLYHVRFKNIYLQAVDVDKFSRRCVMVAQNPNYQTTSSFLRTLVAGTWWDAVWGEVTSDWWLAITVDYPTALSRQGLTVIHQGKYYRSVTGNNTGAEPQTDPTNWSVVADGDPDYLYEVESIEYDFAADNILERIDKRGNRVKIGRAHV